MNAFMVSLTTSVKRHRRNVTPFVMQVIGPIVMIIILGTALKGSFNIGSSMDPTKITVVNEDKGAKSQELIGFLKSESFQNLIQVSLASDINKAKQSLKENRTAGVIEIRSGYSEEFAKSNYDEIKNYLINNDRTTFKTLSSILNGWKNNSAAIQIGLRNGEAMDNIIARLQNTNKIIIEKPLSKDGKLPRAIDYYSVSITAMTLIFTGVLAMGRLQTDFLSEMKFRLQSTSASIGVILTGDLLGTTLMGFAQSLVVLLFTRFVYGVNWGNSWGVVLGTLFLLTLFGQLLASVLTLGLKNANAPQGIISMLAYGFTFLSGGFYTNPIGGPIGRFFSTYGTPNSLAQTAIFGSIYGGSSQVIFLCMGILAVSSLLLLSMTIGLAKRRGL